MLNVQPPAEPTPEQCSAKKRVKIPGSDVRAHAVWWPQMGGYSSRAVVTVGDCKEAWVWHDGQFPFDGDKRQPTQVHLDSSDQWIELFQQLDLWYDEEFHDGPRPYRWLLPEGVTTEQALELYDKAVAWGLWEADPGGVEIVCHELRASLYKPCISIPCPPWSDG